jgi:DUF4097 and DUF4098 domain-containing protein YvlB
VIAGSVELMQVSGDIDIAHLVCEGEMNASTTSGDIQIKDSTCHACVFRTVSGDFDGQEFYPESVELKSVSGDICIKNHDRSRQIDVKAVRTVSGDVSINE